MNDLISIQTRFNEWRKKRIRGIETDEQELRQVTFDLLELIDIDEQAYEKKQDVKKVGISKIVIERPVQKDFSFIPFEVYVDNKFIGKVRAGKNLKFKLPHGKHKLLIKYEYEQKTFHPREGPATKRFSATSDIHKLNLNKGKMKFKCGLGNIQKFFFGMIPYNEGHKIYIEQVNQ